MDKKVNLRAFMEERMKTLKEGKFEIPKSMKELMGRVKLIRGEQGSTMFRNIVIEKNKEVIHE
jgi:hypothetical protein